VPPYPDRGKQTEGRKGPPITAFGSTTANSLPHFKHFTDWRRPDQNPVRGQSLDDLLLFAVTAGNSRNGIRLVGLGRGYKPPLAGKIRMTKGWSEDRIVVNLACENQVTEDCDNLGDILNPNATPAKTVPLRILAANKQRAVLREDFESSCRCLEI
jgi:hypothetical protein